MTRRSSKNGDSQRKEPDLNIENHNLGVAMQQARERTNREETGPSAESITGIL
jgi:hypothetical protein